MISICKHCGEPSRSTNVCYNCKQLLEYKKGYSGPLTDSIKRGKKELTKAIDKLRREVQSTPLEDIRKKVWGDKTPNVTNT